jgi:hypothetical protein
MMFGQISKITNTDQNTWVNTSNFDNNVLPLIVTNCSHNEKYDLITNIYVRPNITLTFLANNKDNPHFTFHSHDQLMDEQYHLIIILCQQYAHCKAYKLDFGPSFFYWVLVHPTMLRPIYQLINHLKNLGNDFWNY